MKLRILCALVVLSSLTAAAQAPDAVSGVWGSDGATFLDLKHDGKGGVTGTVTVASRRQGSDASDPARHVRSEEECGPAVGCGYDP